MTGEEKEDFVSFEIAKKLKEKGFIGNVYIGQYGGYYYHDGEDIDVCYDCVDNANIAANEYLRPTISQVLKWLREEKGIEVYSNYNRAYKHWTYIARAFDDSCYNGVGGFKSYEQAAFTGIEYVLNKLI